MFEIIDELINAIKNDEIYKSYQESNGALNNAETLALLSRRKTLMEDYNRLKSYEKYISLDDIRNDIQKVNEEMNQNEKIMNYYQCYYALNDLLEEVTAMVFDHISDELVMGRFEL